MTQWTVRREAMTDQGEVKTTELVAFHYPVVDGTLADPGLARFCQISRQMATCRQFSSLAEGVSARFIAA